MTAESFPYQPGLRIESLWYLEKLRAIADRKLAQSLFNVYRLCVAQKRVIDGKTRAAGG